MRRLGRKRKKQNNTNITLEMTATRNTRTTQQSKCMDSIQSSSRNCQTLWAWLIPQRRFKPILIKIGSHIPNYIMYQLCFPFSPTLASLTVICSAVCDSSGLPSVSKHELQKRAAPEPQPALAKCEKSMTFPCLVASETRQPPGALNHHTTCAQLSAGAAQVL